MSLPFYVPPEQQVRDKAEFARKGIARGRSIAVIEYVDGLLI
ncbi:MAG: proteasome subunit alpha, partial [Acidimicrobiia bacterium]